MTQATVSRTLQQSVFDRVHECFNIVTANYPNNELSIPSVLFNLRGTTAGQARGGHTVKLNAVLLNENKDHFIDITVTHELAHIFVHQLYGTEYRGNKRISHGSSWKRMMRLLGIQDPKRCHTYDVENARVKKGNRNSGRATKSRFKYMCPCCHKELAIGPTRHKRVQSGTKYFHCRAKPIQPVK